jgi:plastocyanin
MRKLLVLALLATLAGCGGDSPVTPGGNNNNNNNTGGGGNTNTDPNTIVLQGTSFTPSTLTVTRGTQVKWVNSPGESHTITPNGHTAWERVIASGSGQVLAVTFNTAGTYRYYCEPHPGMEGMVVVQ